MEIWLTLCRHSLKFISQWKYLYSDWKFMEIYFWVFNYTSICSHNGFEPYSWQAIICTNDSIVKWHIYTSLGLDKITQAHNFVVSFIDTVKTSYILLQNSHKRNSIVYLQYWAMTLKWHHNVHNGISNDQRLDDLLNRLFSRGSKKTSKFCVTGLCEGNSLVTGGFPSQRASNVENVYIWWCYHEVFNSLRPSDAIWRQRTGSTLAQVMACCLTAPSYYLNQCWLIISKVLWHSCKDNFTTDTPAINHQN